MDGGERMQFIEDDRVEIGEQIGASGWLKSSAICSGVVSKMCGGLHALALAARHRRIAGARLGADLEAPSRRSAA